MAESDAGWFAREATAMEAVKGALGPRLRAGGEATAGRPVHWVLGEVVEQTLLAVGLIGSRLGGTAAKLRYGDGSYALADADARQRLGRLRLGAPGA